MLFLSTPSARRATEGCCRDSKWKAISIHALREEGDETVRSEVLAYIISIHALREEGDLAFQSFESLAVCEFLSTPSARRATIHANFASPVIRNFYPRPPRGGRRRNFVSPPATFDFYPRPPRGGRLRDFSSLCQDRSISIHALREEGDPVQALGRRVAGRFLSTPSARRATDVDLRRRRELLISIHALREEGDTSRFPVVTSP